jgi:hypothetical protein
VLYSGSLYGTNGFFKSTDGGVNWTQILSDDIKKYAPYGGFVGGLAMDPNDHMHLLVSWHQVCAAPYSSACYAETMDGGATWTMRNGDASWNGGEGTALAFLDSNTWLFMSSSNGMWRSTDRGATWKAVQGAEISHGAGQMYRTDGGEVFLGSATGVLYSPDAGSTWSVMPKSGTQIHGLASDGTTVWGSSAFPYNAPMMTSGGFLAYDPDHHILYSANYWQGVWRVVVK